MIAFIVDLQDKPGEVARVAEAIAQKGINIERFSGATAGGRGAVILVTNDEEGTRRALADAGCQVTESELVTASLEHQPGSPGGRRTEARRRRGSTSRPPCRSACPEGKVSIAFATDQPAKARELIGSSEPAGIGIG